MLSEVLRSAPRADFFPDRRRWNVSPKRLAWRLRSKKTPQLEVGY
jgi:hypothetical protein